MRRTEFLMANYFHHYADNSTITKIRQISFIFVILYGKKIIKLTNSNVVSHENKNMGKTFQFHDRIKFKLFVFPFLLIKSIYPFIPLLFEQGAKQMFC